MGLDIPHRWEREIEEVARIQKISQREAIDRIIQAGLERFVLSPESPSASNASLFGSIKGPGAHGSKEAVDQYLAELRAEW